MVKGRRVRAVVACPRTDACCSPHPKRRAGDVLQVNTITAFFQGAQVEIENEEHDQEIHLTLMAKEQVDVTKTPISFQTRSNPPTPHRIELFPEDGVSKMLKKPSTKKSGNHKVTEYFPVRRSVRKTTKIVLEEKQRSLVEMLRNQIEEGLEVKYFSEKGRGVVTSRPFLKGDFVVEYSGDLIDLNEAKKRELQYSQDHTTGCYMYYFKHNNQQYCVDATPESGRLGRLVNHSRNGNLITRTISVDNKPRLVLIAKDDIKEGEELTYDYGDRSRESLKYHPWLAY